MPARESPRNLVISDRPDPVAVFVQPNRWIMRILFVTDAPPAVNVKLTRFMLTPTL